MPAVPIPRHSTVFLYHLAAFALFGLACLGYSLAKLGSALRRVTHRAACDTNTLASYAVGKHLCDRQVNGRQVYVQTALWSTCGASRAALCAAVAVSRSRCQCLGTGWPAWHEGTWRCHSQSCSGAFAQSKCPDQ